MVAVARENAKGNPFRSRAIVAKDVAFTIAAEDNDTINVSLQFKSETGKNITQRVCVRAYIASSNSTLAVATPPTTVAIGTNGVCIEPVSNSYMELITTAAGVVDITIGKSGAATYYLVVVMPDGSLKVSDAITFAA